MRCIVCDQEFKPTHGNQRICSDICRRKRDVQTSTEYLKKRKRKPLLELICPQCGKSFMPKRSNQKFCSRECHVESHRKHSIYDRVCPVCGKAFTAKNIAAKYCSRECKYKANHKSLIKLSTERHAGSLVKKTCKHCGNEFTANNGQRQYCSVTCRRAAERFRARMYQRKRKREPIPEIPTVPILPSKFSPPPPKVAPPSITIPAAVAENRKPTVDELLDWIFSEERRHAL